MKNRNTEEVCCASPGNNAVEMQTTAEFDQDRDEFIINTPTTLAQKYWVCHLHNELICLLN